MRFRAASSRVGERLSKHSLCAYTVVVCRRPMSSAETQFLADRLPIVVRQVHISYTERDDGRVEICKLTPGPWTRHHNMDEATLAVPRDLCFHPPEQDETLIKGTFI